MTARQDDKTASLPAMHGLRARLDYFVFALSLLAIVYTDARGVTEVFALGSLSVKIVDPLTPALFLLLALMVTGRVWPPFLVTLYLAIYGFAFARGLLQNPLGANDGLRRDIIFLVLLLAVSTGAWQRLGTDRIVRLFTAAGMAIAVLSILRHIFGFELFADVSRVDHEFRIYNDGRTLNSVSVVLLSVAIIVRLTRDQLRDPQGNWAFRWDWITIGFFLIIALSGQRTASIGLAMAMSVVLCHRLRLSMHVVILLAAGFLLTLTFLPLEFNAEFVESGFEGKTGTFTYRTLIWAGFFQNMESWPVVNVLFGRPLGDFAAFYVRNTLWTGSLHSAYVGSISLVGYTGLITLMGMALWGLLRAYLNYVSYRRPPEVFTPEIKLMLAAIFFIFGLSYEWRDLSGLMLGVLASSAPLAAIVRQETDSGSETAMPALRR